MFCAKCGTKLQPEAKFCQSCGAQVVFAQMPPMPSTSTTSAPIDATPRSVHEYSTTKGNSKGYQLFVTISKVVVGLGVTGAIAIAGFYFYSVQRNQAEIKAICDELLAKPVPSWPDCAAEQANTVASARPGETVLPFNCKTYNDWSDRAKYENCKSHGSPY